jgi:Arc/MetJ-type ribon-helix-helix transcriptional regulator
MTQVAIQLPDELSQFVIQSVQAGEYPSADDFFINVVSMYKDQVEERLSESDREKFESLRRDIQHAADQLDRGEGSEMDWDEFFAERHRAYAERHAAK